MLECGVGGYKRVLQRFKRDEKDREVQLRD